MTPTKPRIERMNRQERIQHLIMFVTFSLLAITGFVVFLPETYVRFMGDFAERFFEWRGDLHRFSGIGMILVSVYHTIYLFFTDRGRWQLRELLPCKKDLDDLRQMMRHFADPEEPLPQFSWYSYVEKAEYWALVWGVVVMGFTGLMLWFEFLVPKLFLDIALVVHQYEAILAVLAIFVWHFYHVHWKPGVFPMSPIWINGQITEDELRHHHPLAYETVIKEAWKESNES